MSNVVNLDDYREMEDIIKKRLGVDDIIFSAMTEDGEECFTYIPREISDINFSRNICKTLKDRREMLMKERNEN